MIRSLDRGFAMLMFGFGPFVDTKIAPFQKPPERPFDRIGQRVPVFKSGFGVVCWLGFSLHLVVLTVS